MDVFAGNAYMGTGFYNKASKITVRLISRNANDLFDARFWRRRVKYAVCYRKTVMPGADFACCRLIHSEADQMPGLTVDRYGGILSVQIACLGMELVKDTVYRALWDVLTEMGETLTGIYERNDTPLRAREGLPEDKGWYRLEGIPLPESAVMEICENGVRYLVDVENKKPAFSWTRSITVPRAGLPGASRYWTALPMPAPSASMRRWAGQTM